MGCQHLREKNNFQKCKNTKKMSKRLLKSENAKKAFKKQKTLFKKGKRLFKKQTLASSSTFLYSVQKGLYNEAMQSKLCQSLTNQQGVNTLGKKITCNNAKIQKSQKDLKKQKCLLKRKKDF